MMIMQFYLYNKLKIKLVRFLFLVHPQYFRLFSAFPCCATQILCYIIHRKTLHIHLVSAIFNSVKRRNNVSSNFCFCQWISIQFIVNSSFRRTSGIFILQNRTGTSTETKLKVEYLTGLRQGQRRGPIVSYCASPVTCSHAPIPVQCE